jgi:hypothetical protein
MDEDTRALLALLGDGSREILLSLARQLARIEARQAGDVPPADVRAGMAEATEHIEHVAQFIADDARAIPLRDAQIAEIVAWMHARMSGGDLQAQFDTQYIITKQLTGIMQGTRDDIVLLRADFRRLAALLEQSLRTRVEDEAWGQGDADRRRNTIVDRRRAG